MARREREFGGTSGSGELLFDQDLDTGIIFHDHELELNDRIRRDLESLKRGQVPDLSDNTWSFGLRGGTGVPSGGIELEWNGATDEFTFGGEF